MSRWICVKRFYPATTREYGLEITRLVQAAYLAAERGQTIDLTDPAIQQELDSYTSLIAQGKGAEILFR